MRRNRRPSARTQMLTFGEQIKEAKMSKGIIHQIIGPVIDLSLIHISEPTRP